MNHDKTAAGTDERFAGSQVVQAILPAFYSGDLQVLKAHLQPDVVTHQSAGLPYSGTFTGIDGFVSMAEILNAHLEIENLETRMLDSGNQTVVYLDLRFTSRVTGRTARTSNVEWYTFGDDRVASIDIYYKDAGAVARTLEL